MKKLLALVLSIMLFVPFSSATPVYAEDVSFGEMIVTTDKQVYKPGDTVQLILSVQSDATSFVGIDFDVMLVNENEEPVGISNAWIDLSQTCLSEEHQPTSDDFYKEEFAYGHLAVYTPLQDAFFTRDELNGRFFAVNIELPESMSEGTYYFITTPENLSGSTCFWIGGDPYDVSFETVAITVSSQEEESSYQAWLKTDQTSIASDGTMSAYVYMKSSEVLSAAEMNLSVTGGTITNIEKGDDLSASASFYATLPEGKLSFYGNEADASGEDGIKVATVTVAPDASSTSLSLEIKEGVAASSGQASETDPAVIPDEEKGTVTVSVTHSDLVSCEAYAGSKYLLVYTGSVDDGKVAVYNNQEMAWSEKYNNGKGAWILLLDAAPESLVNDDVTANTPADVKTTVSYDGDVNGNSKTNIVDAQIAYDIANNVYPDFEKATATMWFAADVNADMTVTATDARAIQTMIHAN